ncbi:MAG: hypothetical protein TUN42_04260 [Dehalogenimonas sp.]
MTLITKIVPLMVAASNAAADELLWAGNSNGAACDGTNDQTDLANADAAGSQGKVTLSAGTFNIQAALTLNDGCTFVGHGGDEEAWGTRLLLGGTNYGITLSPTVGKKMSKIWDLLIETPQNFATIALHVLASVSVWNVNKILDNVNVKAYESGTFETNPSGPDVTAGGIGVQISASASSALAKSHFGPISIAGFEKGFQLLADGSGSQYKYLNGNCFDWLNLCYNKYPFIIKNSSTSSALIEITNNLFKGIDIQPILYGAANTQQGVLIEGSTYEQGVINGNNIDYLMEWDWDNADSNSIKITGNAGTYVTAYYNFIRGRYNINDATRGVSDDYTGTNGYKRFYVPQNDAWTQTAYGHNFFEKITQSWSGA